MAQPESPGQPGLHVVHIISGLLHGGAETVLYRLVTAPGQSGRHTVISMGGDGVLGPRLREAGVAVITLDMEGASGILRGLWRLYRLLRTLRPDVVQTWMYHADLLGGIIARLAGIRAVAWGIRNSGVSLGESSRQSRVIAWVCARLSHWVPGVIVACAHKAAQVHIGWGYCADRMLVASNGYDLSRWHPDLADRRQVRAELGIADDELLLGCVARWNPLKDHANLLAAFAQSLLSRPELRLVLVGEGMSLDNAGLVALAREYGELDRLVLMGRRDDVPRLMRAFDIHVLSSLAEGFPNVVSEAMASGVGVVVTDAGDAAAIVGDLGWVVPARDPAALSNGLDVALAECGSMAWSARLQAARASVGQRYSLEAMVDRYQDIWGRLAQDYPVRHSGEDIAPQVVDADQADRAPKLLFFVNNPAFFLSHRLALALAAKDAGMDVHVVTMDGPTVARIVALGLTHHCVPLSRSGTNPWVELRSLYAFWTLLCRVRPDLVHAVTIKPVLYGGIACRLARVPSYVAAVSGLGYVFTRPHAGFDWLRRVTMRLYGFALGHKHSRVIFQNTKDRDVLINAGAVKPEQAVMIRGSGVELDRFVVRPLPDGQIVVVMAARLLHDKGVLEFVEAARQSTASGSGILWRLAGSPDPGNPASVTDGELGNWQREGVIEYVGECDDIPALYADAHIVVLPSYREGLPKSLIEAAACGRPVVTTDVPGCRDAIEPGVTGVLVPPRQSVALADAVLELAADEPRRLRMGEAGRRLAEEAFGLDQIIQAHLGIYRGLLSGSKGQM